VTAEEVADARATIDATRAALSAATVSLEAVRAARVAIDNLALLWPASRHQDNAAGSDTSEESVASGETCENPTSTWATGSTASGLIAAGSGYMPSVSRPSADNENQPRVEPPLVETPAASPPSAITPDAPIAQRPAPTITVAVTVDNKEGTATLIASTSGRMMAFTSGSAHIQVTMDLQPGEDLTTSVMTAAEGGTYIRALRQALEASRISG
jgi:hypothetical protein